MAEREREGGGGRAGGPTLRPVHRQGRPFGALYAVMVAVIVVIVVVVLVVGWATGLQSIAIGPKPPAPITGATASGVAPSRPATQAAKPPAHTPVSQPQTSTLQAESAAAVKAAALPFPNPAAVTPETITHTSPSRKLVAITIDDGIPFNMKILELFERRKLSATTFVLGEFAAQNPDLIARLDRDGFEIANHTWDHATLTKLSDAGIRSELSRAQQSISKVTHTQAPYMRPPGGATSIHIRRLAGSMGYRVVLWDKSFADTSRAATPQRLFHNVMDDLKPGDVILCHWGGKATYEALKLILPEMQRRGFTPVTMSEMLKYSSTSAGTAG